MYSNPCDRYLSDPSYFLVISWTGDPAAILDILLEVFVTDRKSCVPSIPQMERNLRVLWTVPPLLRFYVSLLRLCFWWFYYTRYPYICQHFFQKFFEIFVSSFILNELSAIIWIIVLYFAHFFRTFHLSSDLPLLLNQLMLFPAPASRHFCPELGFLTPQSPESLIWPIFLCQIYFYVLRTIVLYAIIYLYITFRRMPWD